MATKFKFEIESDGLNDHQAQAFSDFVKSLKEDYAPKVGFSDEDLKGVQVKDPIIVSEGVAKHDTPAKKRRAPKFTTPEEANEPEANAPEANAPEANEPEANAPEANEPEANEPEATPEETVQGDNVAPEPSNDVTLDMLKKLVSAKQANHRDAIKAYFAKRDGARTSTLPDEFYQEFFDLLTAMA